MTTEARSPRSAPGLDPFECPICRRTVPAGERLEASRLDPAVAELVLANSPGWSSGRGLCVECAARFQAARQYLQSHRTIRERTSDDILPTPVRLGALDQYRGRGVTIAFLDSG